MAVSLELPDLGAGPQGGLFAEWYQPDAASAKAGELVCPAESAFIAYELEATQPGVLRHRLRAGATGPVGTPLGVILAHGETIDSPSLVEPPAKRPLKDAAVTPERPPAREPETVEAAPGETDESVDGRDGRRPREAERVVLPFPRRFANVPALDWDTVPGDAVQFS